MCVDPIISSAVAEFVGVESTHGDADAVIDVSREITGLSDLTIIG